MTCPRCGQPDAAGPSCPRCGVVFAKLRPRASAAGSEARGPASPVSPPAVAARPPRSEPRSSGVPILVGALFLAAAAAVVLPRARRASVAEPSPSPKVVEPAPPSIAPPPPPPAPAVVERPLEIEQLKAAADDVAAADRDAALALALRLESRQPLGPAELQSAEALYARHPEEDPVKGLLEAVLVTVASQERSSRQFPRAAVYLRRASEVRPQSLPPRLELVALMIDSGDWSGAETAAREALAIAPRDHEALKGLGYALLRQDRNREAAEALRACLDVRESADARAWLDRLDKGMADERGMTEQRLAHFHVRYDGAAHEDVGREILRALERHYATLTTTLGHQPEATIPVILFSQQKYYDASGAPAWSGGVYDLLDGRIRIPIGGLTASLTPDMDQTIAHELTHAFVADLTKGAAPRLLHEGYAQYVEGKRIATQLTSEQLSWLADGRIQNVQGFYLGALAFVEHLMAQRGQGGMNDLLRRMGQTGDVDGAFRHVYGQGFDGTVQAWANRLRQIHGS